MNDKVKTLAEQVGLTYQPELEEFAKLVILEYKKERKESKRETKAKLGYSRIGLNNI